MINSIEQLFLIRFYSQVVMLGSENWKKRAYSESSIFLLIIVICFFLDSFFAVLQQR